MSTRNCKTSLKRRNRGNPMRSYDALPADLRHWLAAAVLPWSAASVQKVWQRALKACRGDRAAALARLSDVERRLLERDVARIWCGSHPYLSAPRDQAPT
ncbi:hypothetical protein SAMN04488003_1367 [Loktanella fryxellensis]|uniref:Uncharacterized protein n=1 Tax=Loktanella fryxellensis TaxID=245187 RepID=A0A1H8JCL2_9RHOB|nr:DUF6525 family protein [Loktanella fryxellensis]SEN78593.1 hypothetical protein SAMN04488003_1367 [Loktanella fryxellensis]